MSSVWLTSEEIKQNLRSLKLISGDEIVGVLVRYGNAQPDTTYIYLPVKLIHIVGERGPMVVMTGFYPDVSQPIVPISANHLIWSIKPPNEVCDAYLLQYQQVLNYERFSNQTHQEQVKASQELSQRQQEFPPTRVH